MSERNDYYLQDKNLSLKAKGLMGVMLSKPDDWDCTVEGLIRICKENKTAVANALKELKENGYLVVEKEYPTKTYGLFDRKQKNEN